MRQVDLTDRGKTLSGRNYLLLRRAPITYRSFRAMTPSTLALKESAISLSSLTPLFASHSIVFGRWAPFADSWHVEAAYSQPIYLDLSGPQTSEKFHFSIEIGTSF